MNIIQFIGLPFKDGLDVPQFIADLFKWLTDTDFLPIISKITDANHPFTSKLIQLKRLKLVSKLSNHIEMSV